MPGRRRGGVGVGGGGPDSLRQIQLSWLALALARSEWRSECRKKVLCGRIA